MGPFRSRAARHHEFGSLSPISRESLEVRSDEEFTIGNFELQIEIGTYLRIL